MLAKITIIGRPNVGTRDISEFEYTDDKNDLTYILADSGWLDYSSDDDEVATDITERTERSIIESDLLVWVIEYDRCTELDQFIYRVIKKHKVTNFIVLANKADNETKVMEAWSLAGKWEMEFFPVSSSHNAGISDVKRFIAKYLVSKGLNYKKWEEDDTLKMAFVGRPNVGKSSIVNTIVGSDRVMVKDMAGTTRDTIDTKFHYADIDFTLIDTAWIRRLSKVWTRNIENWSVMRSERALKRADVIAVIVDGFEWIVGQDLSLIGRAMEEKKWLIIIVNKWDKVLDKPWVDKAHMMERYTQYLQEKIEFLPWVSVIFTSATEKKRLTNILDEAIKISEERHKRVKTSIFNEFLEQLVYKHPPTGNKKSHSPKIYYGSQVDANPPKFVVSVNNPNHFHFSYKRYMENKIRDNFWFEWTPITIEFKGRGKHKDVVK